MTRVDRARAQADAMLDDQHVSRWPCGVLGPRGAEDAGIGESSTMSMQCLVTPFSSLMVHLRFLQVQQSAVHGNAVERELAFELSPFDLEAGGTVLPVVVEGGAIDDLQDQDEARVVRRWPLTAEMRAAVVPSDGCMRLDITLLNLHAGCTHAMDATRHSLIGTHLIIEAHDAEFISLLQPPEELAAPAAACSQHRLWPVLGGETGDTDVLLGLPISLDDHPDIAARSWSATAAARSSPSVSAEQAWPVLADIRDVEPPSAGADITSRP